MNRYERYIKQKGLQYKTKENNSLDSYILAKEKNRLIINTVNYDKVIIETGKKIASIIEREIEINSKSI